MTTTFIGTTPFPLSNVFHSILNLSNLLIQLIDGLLDVRYIIRKLSFCTVISEKLDFAEADFRSWGWGGIRSTRRDDFSLCT